MRKHKMNIQADYAKKKLPTDLSLRLPSNLPKLLWFILGIKNLFFESANND